MQAVGVPYSSERFFAYLCREYSSHLVRGQSYSALMPTIGVVWYANAPEPRYGFHEAFRLRGDRTGELYSSALTLHVLQLGLLSAGTMVPKAEPNRALRLWATLLRAKSRKELDALVQEEPTMSEAVSHLKMLSDDPEVARLARQRAEAEYFHELALRKLREEAEAEGQIRGRAEGEIRGRAEGKAETVLRLIALKFGPSDPRQEQRVRNASLSELDHWTEKILFAADIQELFG